MPSRKIHSGSTLKPNKLLDQSGSILATVLLVLIILLTIFISAMTYALARYSHHASDQNNLIATHLSQAGIAHQLSRLRQFGIEERDYTWQAPNGGWIQTEVQSWGPYLRVASEGKYANQVVRTSCLIGSAPTQAFEAAITVCEENTPLTAAGRTKIIGAVNTGPLGIMPGRFRGEHIADTGFLEGINNKEISLELPMLDTSVINLYYAEVDARRQEVAARLAGTVVLGPEDTDRLQNYTGVHIENNLVFDNVSWRTFDSIKSFFVDGSVEITGSTKLSGLIEIIANGSISTRDSAVVDHVILSAPDSIVISDAASFSGIAITMGKITVEDRANLEYPSLLLIELEGDRAVASRGITLSGTRKLESVCFLRSGADKAESFDQMLYLDTFSVFTGFLVSQGYADIRGTVLGSVVTNLFHFEYHPTTYVNWLKDAYVNRPALDFVPAMPVLKEDTTLHFHVARQDRVF